MDFCEEIVIKKQSEKSKKKKKKTTLEAKEYRKLVYSQLFD